MFPNSEQEASLFTHIPLKWISSLLCFTDAFWDVTLTDRRNARVLCTFVISIPTAWLPLKWSINPGTCWNNIKNATTEILLLNWYTDDFLLTQDHFRQNDTVVVVQNLDIFSNQKDFVLSAVALDPKLKCTEWLLPYRCSCESWRGWMILVCKLVSRLNGIQRVMNR